MTTPQTSPSPAEAFCGFDFSSRTRLIFGANAISRLGHLARELGATRVLLVTDPGLVKAGHAHRVQQCLKDCDLSTALFDQVRENPTTRDVENCLAAAQAAQIDLLIGLGGGSAMDTAKGCNFLLTNGGRMQDYWGVGKATRPMLPFIAVPTTAGTGSECQSAALIADEKSHHKMACLDTKAVARVAILDPQLTVSQPALVTAHTGIDAIAHAVETAVTTKRNHLSIMFSREAFKLTVPTLGRVLTNPADLEARGRMLLGAAFAGIAIENSMLGAAHAAANPLTAQFGVVHGEAVGIMLPSVVRFNCQDEQARQSYAELAAAPELASMHDGTERAIEALLSRLDSLLNRAHVARSLLDLGVTESEIEALAEQAAIQWTAAFNPRKLTAAQFAELYVDALKPRGEGDGA